MTSRMAAIFAGGKHKPYKGSVNGSTFVLTRIIKYRNSFLPRIKGHVIKGFDKTEINVKMRSHPIVLLFMLIWCVGVGLGFLAILTSSIRRGTFEPTLLIPLAMLLLGYGITLGGFKYESIKSKKHLAELFEAEIKN